MEKENQEVPLSFARVTIKQQFDSLRIFQPKYHINQAFILSDSEQKLSSGLLNQPFQFVPIQSSHYIMEQSKFYLKEKSIISNERIEPTIRIQKITLPSIENIVIQYQRKQNQLRQLNGLLPCKIYDICNNKPQYSSIEIKTAHLIKEFDFRLKKHQSLESESLQQVPPQLCEDQAQQNSITTSIKYIESSFQFAKITVISSVTENTQISVISAKIQQIKQRNKQLELISQCLRGFAKNRREIVSKENRGRIDWKLFKTIIEKEFRCGGNY